MISGQWLSTGSSAPGEPPHRGQQGIRHQAQLRTVGRLQLGGQNGWWWRRLPSGLLVPGASPSVLELSRLISCLCSLPRPPLSLTQALLGKNLSEDHAGRGGKGGTRTGHGALPDRSLKQLVGPWPVGFSAPQSGSPQ